MKGFYVSAYEHLKEQMLAEPKVWLVTGVAGFIGSNLLEALLRLDQRVIGLDNYATGSRHNLEQVRELVGPDQWKNFRQIEPGHANPGVGHSVIYVIAIGCAKVAPPVYSRGEYDVCNGPVLLLRQTRRQQGLRRAIANHDRMLL